MLQLGGRQPRLGMTLLSTARAPPTGTILIHQRQRVFALFAASHSGRLQVLGHHAQPLDGLPDTQPWLALSQCQRSPFSSEQPRSQSHVPTRLARSIAMCK